jgi:hypothetical protein
MPERTIKLQFKPSKSHKNHLDDWNHFTKDGQVGEYPYDVGKGKLADFPLNFTEYKQPAEPKKIAKPILDPFEKPKKVEDEPDKMMKTFRTKTK